jgi:hypoxanthine phosphoribosyltransferase
MSSLHNRNQMTNGHSMKQPEFETIIKWGCRRTPLEIEGRPYELVVSKNELKEQVKALGLKLRSDYRDLPLTTIQILEGGSWIHGQTTHQLPEASTHLPASIKAKRYGNRTEGGEVRVYCEWIDNHADERAKIEGRHCLLFDDVLDTGETASKVLGVVASFNPASLKTVFMVRKKVAQQLPVRADYVLFDVDDLWLIGAGLDDKGTGRGLPYIVCKPPERTD